jgi:hypothetical protein
LRSLLRRQGYENPRSKESRKELENVLAKIN